MAHCVLEPAMIAAQWKPGQSGNPKGRAKFKTFEEVVRGVLNEPAEAGGMDQFEALARVVVDEAIKTRNTHIIKVLIERLWPITKTLDVNARLDGAIEIEAQVQVDLTNLSGEEQSKLRELARQAISGGEVDAEVGRHAGQLRP